MLSAYGEIERLLGEIRAVSHSPVIDRCSDQIATLCRGYLSQAVNERWLELHLSDKERRFMDALFARPGKTVTRDSIMDALYFDQGNEPGPKILDVFATRIRDKICGSEFAIENVFGVGFRGHKTS